MLTVIALGGNALLERNGPVWRRIVPSPQSLDGVKHDSITLVDIAQLPFSGDNGLLAIDESIPTGNKRFARPNRSNPAHVEHEEQSDDHPRAAT